MVILVSLLLTVLAGFLFFPKEYCFAIPNQAEKLAFLILGTVLAGILGLADDIYDLKPAVKLLAQLFLTCSFALFGYRFEILHVPGFTAVPLSFLSVPFTAIWMMGVINGFNFMDGVDGLAGSVSIVVLVALGAADTLQGGTTLWVPVAAMLGALVVFLAYNRYPAKIYLGDTGASVLGFISAAGLVTLGQSGPLGLDPLNPSQIYEAFPFQIILCTLFVGYPFMEAFLSTIRRGIKRFYFGRSIEWSEKEHIHHRLLVLGWSPMSISGVGAFFNLFMAGSGLMAMTQERALAVFSLIPVIVILTFLMQRMGFFEFMDVDSIVKKRPHYLIAHRFLEMQKMKLHLISSTEEVLALVSQTCAEFGVQGFWIKAEAGLDGKGGLIFYWERPHDIQREYLQFLKTEIMNGDFEVFKDRVALEDGKLEAYWIFEPNSQESDLDVEYRVLVGDYMKEILRWINKFNTSNESQSLARIGQLAYARVRSSVLKQRYGPNNQKEN
jgi:UDP-GlcNAc:undecaprenyl-phosphate GlcNAc-1-phosphate transferase